MILILDLLAPALDLPAVILLATGLVAAMLHEITSFSAWCNAGRATSQ